MHVDDLGVLAQQRAEARDGLLRIPELVEPFTKRARRVFERRHLIRRTERAPADVLVRLIQNRTRELRRFPLRIGRDDSPMARADGARAARLALVCERLHVEIVADAARGEEAVAHARGAGDRGRRHAAHENSRRARGLRRYAQPVDHEVLASDADGFARPRLPQNLDAFFHQARPLRELAAEGVVLELPIAETDAEIEAAVRENRERGRVLGDPQRICERQKH